MVFQILFKTINIPGVKPQCSFRDLRKQFYCIKLLNNSVVWQKSLWCQPILSPEKIHSWHMKYFLSIFLPRPVNSQCQGCWALIVLFHNCVCVCMVGEPPFNPSVTPNLGFHTYKVQRITTGSCLSWQIQWYSNNLSKVVINAWLILKAP